MHPCCVTTLQSKLASLLSATSSWRSNYMIDSIWQRLCIPANVWGYVELSYRNGDSRSELTLRVKIDPLWAAEGLCCSWQREMLGVTNHCACILDEPRMTAIHTRSRETSLFDATRSMRHGHRIRILDSLDAIMSYSQFFTPQ